MTHLMASLSLWHFHESKQILLWYILRSCKSVSALCSIPIVFPPQSYRFGEFWKIIYFLNLSLVVNKQMRDKV